MSTQAVVYVINATCNSTDYVLQFTAHGTDGTNSWGPDQPQNITIPLQGNQQKALRLFREAISQILLDVTPGGQFVDPDDIWIL